MIRNLLATTALATLLATAAYAQQDPATAPAKAPAEATQPAAPAAPVMKTDAYLATNMIGESVYNGTGDTAENIGDVNDIVISNDGMVQSVVIGVGGFLGIGEKSVAIEMGKLQWAEANGDRWLVTDTSKEQLEQLPAFERQPYEPAPAPVAANDPAIAPAPAETTAQAPAADPAAPATDATTTAAIDKSALTQMPATELKAEELVGTTVYGANDENIGEIGDIVLTQDGKVDAVIIDVGGFLGVGEKPVAVGFDNLAFMADKDGKKYLYTNFSKEQLDKQPAYDDKTFAEKRDEQLMRTQ